MVLPSISYELGDDEFDRPQLYRCPNGDTWGTIPGLPGFLERNDGTRLSFSLIMLGGQYRVRDDEDKNVVFVRTQDTPCWVSTDPDGVATHVIPLKWEIIPDQD